MLMLLFPAMIVMLAIQCYAAYYGNESRRNIARVVILAFQLVLAFAIVPSGFSFSEAVAWWLNWWNIPHILPFMFFLIGGVLISWSMIRPLFLLGFSCFAIGSAIRCTAYFSLVYSFSPIAAFVFGSLLFAFVVLLFIKLKCPFGFTGIILFLCGFCVAANGAFAALEAFRFFHFGNKLFFFFEFLLNPRLISPILLCVAGFLRAKSVLLGVSSPKRELAASLCFGLPQIFLIFAYCAMAAASV